MLSFLSFDVVVAGFSQIGFTPEKQKDRRVFTRRSRGSLRREIYLRRKPLEMSGRWFG